MNGNQPKISIVTSVLNGASTIQRLIDSLTVQTCKDREHIVMDGGSQDGTATILQQNDHLISHWESSPDRGIYHAWNKAIERVSGDWVCFLGADDYLWDSGVLQAVVSFLKKDTSGCRVVYGITRLVNPEGEILNSIGQPWEEVKPLFRQNMSIPNPSTFYHRSLFDEYGGFDESFKITGDYEFALRELRENDALFMDGLVVTGMQAGGWTENRKHAVATAIETVRAQRKHGLMKIPVWLSGRVIRIRVHNLMAAILGERSALRIVNIYRSLLGRPRLTR